MKRQVSSACQDSSLFATTDITVVPGLDMGLYSAVRNEAGPQAQAAYARYLQQLSINAGVTAITGSPGGPVIQYGSYLPIFPNYALPDINNYQVNLAKPDASGLGWRGLSARPELQFLLQAPAPLPASSLAPLSSVNYATVFNGATPMANVKL